MTDSIASLSTLLFDAYVAHRGIDVPETLAELDIDRAYDVQDAVVARREAAGSVRRGWKLGITSPVKQRVMGIDHPLFGRIFADGECRNGSKLALDSMIAPRTEPEIAIELGCDIDASMSSDALRQCVAFIAPALEVTDSRYRSGRRTAVELVADNTSSSFYVLAPRIAVSAAPLYADLTTELVRNGDVVFAGSTADVLGDPFNALAALAAHLHTRGLRASAGDVILSGAITDAIPVGPGDAVEARIAGLGTATVTFV